MAAAPPKYDEINQQQQPYNPGYQSYQNAVLATPQQFYGATPQQQVVFVAPAPVGRPVTIVENRAHPRHCDREQAAPKYIFMRGFQCMVSIVALGLQCGLFSYDRNYWFYWLWLLVIPLAHISVTMKHGCSGLKINPGRDVSYCFVWLIHLGVVAGVYYGFYDYGQWWYSGSLNTLILELLLSTCGFLAFLHLATACCCKSRE